MTTKKRWTLAMWSTGFAFAVALSGCQTANTTGADAAKSPSKTPLSVLYAGSMTNVMEQRIRPNADKLLGIHFQGEGKGSSELAQMIVSHIAQPDVFISASPSVNTKDLMGKKHGDLADWYLTLAQDQLVIAYAPKSAFASQLKAAASGSTPWYKVLQEKGFRFGRTDPALDPKGADTILMMKLAAKYYHQPSLATAILGTAENPKQVFPEEDLLAQLTSGQIDAVIAYKHEAVEWNLPFITLPSRINLGSPGEAAHYATATWTSSDGKTTKGAPILFTITIPATVQHPIKAQAFVRYMEVGHGHQQLMNDGFTPLKSITVGGDKQAVPQPLRSLIGGMAK